jgi:hypothetical protein
MLLLVTAGGGVVAKCRRVARCFVQQAEGLVNNKDAMDYVLGWPGSSLWGPSLP